MLKPIASGVLSAVIAIHSGLAQAATPHFKSELLGSFGLSYSYLSGAGAYPLALQNDGAMVVYGPAEYAVDYCPHPAVTQQDLMCTPPITRLPLALARVGQMATLLPVDVKNQQMRFNHVGQMAAWNAYQPTSVALTDLSTGASTPLFTGSATPDCPALAGKSLANVLLSDKGELIGLQDAACGAGAGMYVWSTSAQTNIPSPSGYTISKVVGANTSGQIALTATRNTSQWPSPTAAFIWKAGSYKALMPSLFSILSGYWSTEAVAVNDSGTVAGQIVKRDGTRHAAIWQATTATDLGTLSGFRNSMALAINPDGLVLACAYNQPEDLYATDASTKLFIWTPAGGKRPLSEVISAATTPDQLPTGCNYLYSPYGDHPADILTNGQGQWRLHYSPSSNYLVTPQP